MDGRLIALLLEFTPLPPIVLKRIVETVKQYERDRG